MRSIPQAMTWEFFRGRFWELFGGALAGNVLPVLVFNAMQKDGELPHADLDGFVTMHFTFLLLNIFIFGAAIFHAHGPVARLFPLPVSNASIVFWRLTPAMAAIGLQTALSMWVLNAAYHLGWPVWGPALFATGSLGIIVTTCWLTQGTIWMPLAIGGVSAVMGMWLKSRYGKLFFQPSDLWLTISTSELVTLLAAIAFAYGLGLFAIRRGRRGDVLLTLNQLTIAAPTVRTARAPARPPFRSAAYAQFWYDWHRAGWIFPNIVTGGLIVGMTLWCFLGRDLNDLLTGLGSSAMLLPISAFVCSLVLGTPGTKSTGGELGSFIGTRPLSSRQFGALMWQQITASLAIGFAVWGVFSAGLLAYLWSQATLPHNWSEFMRSEGTAKAGVATLLLQVLIAWIVAAFVSAALLSGRSGLMAKIFVGWFVCWIAMVFAIQHLPDRADAVIGITFMIVVLTAVLGGIAWAWWQANVRNLVSPRTLATSLALTASGILAAFVAYLTIQPPMPWPLVIIVCVLTILATAPVAVIPLSFAWNLSLIHI